jgi:hypothetical protein
MFTLPYPGKPANGDTLDAGVVQANLTALAQAIQSFDGSQITPGSISAAAFAAAINPNTTVKETLRPFVASGCTWQIVSNLQGTMISGVIYVNGIRATIGGVGSYNFTASQDTYIDADYNGNLYYIPVGNGAASPALTANAIRLAKIVTNTTAITSIVQGGMDSNNVLVYPHGTSGSTSYVDANGWTVMDHGNYREYCKKGSVADSLLASGWHSLLVSGNLPVGIASITNGLFVTSSVNSSDPAITASLSAPVGATSLSANVSNQYASSVSFNLIWNVVLKG